MAAIEHCRSAALGGHVERCEDCGFQRIAYNSCRNRHCPKCQGAAAKDWLAARQADLLPVGYFHLVFTLPAELAPIAYQNKAVLYDLLFRTAAETLLTIAVDPKHLGARIGATAVLHSWGSAMTHHPHLHMIVPGGGMSLDGSRAGCAADPASSCRCECCPVCSDGSSWPGSPTPTRRAGWRSSANSMACATGKPAPPLAPLRKKNWFVYAKPPFAGPEAVLAYLARYTHRVAISNSRLVGLDERGVTFHYKDYRSNGQARYRMTTLAPDEFIRRFLLHTLPKGFHRIRHYGLLASAGCRVGIARARELLAAPMPSTETPVQHDDAGATLTLWRSIGCHVPVAAATRTIVETFERGGTARAAIARCRGPDRHVMTTVTAWFHPPARRNMPLPALRRCRAGARERRCDAADRC